MNVARLVLVLGAMTLSACSTTVKMVEHGPIAANYSEGSELMAPMLMQYEFHADNERHIIYFFDGDKHRYDIHVPGNTDTKKGIVFYLPANKEYAVLGLFIQRGPGRDFLFGDNLDLFRVSPTTINVIPYFDVTEVKGQNYFVAKERKHEKKDLDEAEKKFGSLPPYNPVKIRLIHDFEIR